MPFAIPIIWTRPPAHDRAQCNGCANNVHGTNRKKTGALIYKSTVYGQMPIPHSDRIPVPRRPVH